MPLEPPFDRRAFKAYQELWSPEPLRQNDLVGHPTTPLLLSGGDEKTSIGGDYTQRAGAAFPARGK
jgi:hypothetical protein